MGVCIIKHSLGAARSYHSSSGLLLVTVAIVAVIITPCRADDLTSSSNSLTSSTPTTTTTSPAVSQQPTDYDPYLKGITGPLGAEDLEYGLDYYSEKVLLNEFNFDPLKIVKVLIDSAAAHNTTPEQFLLDMQDLVYLQNRSRAEAKDGPSGTTWEDTAVFRTLGISQGENFRESWKIELKRLEKKYRVSSECNEPDSTVTAARLALMFPHYLNIEQKPFASPKDVYSDRYGNRLVPSFFQRPEFGGFIPHAGILNETTRLAIFTVHLHTMSREDKEDVMPFRTKCVIVKRRMEKSLLSDDRRVRFLENNNVITKDGGLTYPIRSAYDYIPDEFKERTYFPQTYTSRAARRSARIRVSHETYTPYY